MNHLKTTEDDELASSFKLRINDEFDAKFKYFEQLNKRKLSDYNVCFDKATFYI